MSLFFSIIYSYLIAGYVLRALNFSKPSEKAVNGICHCEGLKRPITPSLRGALATKQSHPSAKVLRLLQLLRSFASLAMTGVAV